MASQPKFAVDLYLNPRHDHYHFSKVYSGLDVLARQKVIRLRIKQAFDPGNTLDARVTELACGARRWLVFDVDDHSTRFGVEALDRCDVYFKRSYHAPDLAIFPQAKRHKIRPFGLNYACTSRSGKWLFFRHWGVGLAGRMARSPRMFLRELENFKTNVRGYVRIPDYRLFEQGPEVSVNPLVLFQTRVWEPEESSEDLATVNDERVALIRELRKVFGKRFRGGIVPTPFARRHYPDVLLQEAYSRADYIRMVQRFLIGIYTRGLHQSLAFKLPEYLAASMCLVSDPLRNKLPQPLVAGRHYLQFETTDECLAQCERLLGRPEEASQMRRQNWQYYRQWIRPPEHLLSCLERAFLEEAGGG
jgi:hypothetical protein